MRSISLPLFAVLALVLPATAQEIAPPEVETGAPELVTEDPLVPQSTLDDGEELPENPYYDDRSTAASVVESFYNAINRAEYLRAWSYFERDVEPADADALVAEFEDFAAGYENTATVQLLVGPEITEGTAGTVYYSIPVAISATNVDGSSESFAGCYTLKLEQPSVQATPPFKPLAIVAGELQANEGALEAILPAQCLPQ